MCIGKMKREIVRQNSVDSFAGVGEYSLRKFIIFPDKRTEVSLAWGCEWVKRMQQWNIEPPGTTRD
jgi:hypothetical protein